MESQYALPKITYVEQYVWKKIYELIEYCKFLYWETESNIDFSEQVKFNCTADSFWF